MMMKLKDIAHRENFPKMVRDIFSLLFLDETKNTLRQTSVLQFLLMSTRVDHSILSQEQLKMLLPYIADIQTSDGLESLFVLSIYKQTFPHLSISQTFASEIRKLLLVGLSRMGLRELKEAVPCLWETCKCLQDSGCIIKVLNACLGKLNVAMRSAQNADRMNLEDSLVRPLLIIGQIGQHCDMETFADQITQRANWPGRSNNEGSIVSFLVDVLCHFCGNTWSMTCRKTAMQSLGITR